MKVDYELTFYSDEGHGWLQVPRVLLQMFEIAVSVFSHYSYGDEDYVYLEEDCDFTRFMERLPKDIGVVLVEETCPYSGEGAVRELPSIGRQHPLSAKGKCHFFTVN